MFWPSNHPKTNVIEKYRFDKKQQKKSWSNKGKYIENKQTLAWLEIPGQLKKDGPPQENVTPKRTPLVSQQSIFSKE